MNICPVLNSFRGNKSHAHQWIQHYALMFCLILHIYSKRRLKSLTPTWMHLPAVVLLIRSVLYFNTRCLMFHLISPALFLFSYPPLFSLVSSETEENATYVHVKFFCLEWPRKALFKAHTFPLDSLCITYVPQHCIWLTYVRFLLLDLMLITNVSTFTSNSLAGNTTSPSITRIMMSYSHPNIHIETLKHQIH